MGRKIRSGFTVSPAMMRADCPRRESLQGAFGADNGLIS
jgi:hypothetical protein